ncbi:MAG: HlyD family efflux transporter periplasmic adaptor subunit, partial [Eubacteriales bacterium]|nr:HlyD family efflux transporter periplasmic adaptor subunit [Eubacteriales bacterium]
GNEPGGNEPGDEPSGNEPNEDIDRDIDDGLEGNTEDIPNSYEILLTMTCNGSEVSGERLVVGEDGVTLPSARAHNNQTYWLKSAVRNSDGAELLSLRIPGFPIDGEGAQDAWKDVWEDGVTLNYTRSTQIKSDQVVEDTTLQVEAGKETALCFSAYMEGIPSGGVWTWTVTPSEGENVLKATPNGNFLILSGKPEAADEPVEYTVEATYSFNDSTGKNYLVKENFSFSVKAVENDDLGETRGSFYMILKVTQDNRERGAYLTWQGLHVFCYEDGSYGMTLFDASSLEDYTLEELEEEEMELPDIDFGSGYTAGEIARMRADQEKKVKELDLAVRMAEAEFNIMQAEVNDGTVSADFDGKVVSVLTEEEARQDKRPLLKVSAGGGFYVEVSVNELEKDNLKIGQEVTVNDWNTGMTYTGTVESIGDFPVSPNGWSSDDNANVTYYPFTVFVDSTADLQAGNYVNVNYSTSENENGVYLQNAFIRTEQGRSYIFVEGENGKLEKRYVTVGKSLWGSYTQVLSGLTEDDFLAFPYGKTVKEGAPAVESDNLSALYSY